MSEILVATGLHAGYGLSTVLEGISVALRPGHICAILGRNGVGKTTLIRSLCGHCRVREGSVRLAGEDVTNLAPHLMAMRSVGLVPQGRRLFRSLSVREHLTVGARHAAAGAHGWTAERVLDTFPALRERLSNLGGMLSGGEQSMVAIGRALVGNPRVLLLDEPSEGLSPALVKQVGDVLQMLRDDGIAILLVEQNFGLAMRLADTVHIMSKGRVVHSGSADELRSAPEIKARFLGI